MNGFLKTVIGGAIGMAALYAVGKMAYSMGKEVAEAECRLEEMKRQMEAGSGQQDESKAAPDALDGAEWKPTIIMQEPFKPNRKPNLLRNAAKIFRGNPGMIRNLIKNPEGHRLEAFVDKKGLHVDVVPG